MFADSIGMALSDTAKIAANAGTAVLTDAVDLGLGVFDVVGQTAAPDGSAGFVQP